MIPPVLLAFLCSLVVALALTPVSRWVARRIGAVDAPGELKVHAAATPRFGGSALWAATLVGCAIALPGAGPGDHRGLLVALAGASAMALMGAMDDVVGLTARVRFAGGLLVAVLTVGVILGLAGRSSALDGAFAVFCVLWFVGNANAMNMIDGLDGLAAGVAAIAALGLGGVALASGATGAALLGFGLAGACGGFLRYNFRPASTFMGDVGSLFLGSALAAALVLLAAEPVATGRPAALLGALVALGLPVGDMLLAMARRRLNHRPLFHGDRSHCYDQLRDRFGLSVVATVLTCYALGVVFAVAAVCIALLPAPAACGATAAVVVVTAVAVLAGGFLRRETSDE